jgi:solute carrier family 50 protein (sugar transporter)
VGALSSAFRDADTPKREARNQASITSAVVVGVAVLGWLLSPETGERQNFLGMGNTIGSLLMFGSQAGNIKQAFASRSSALLAPPFAVAAALTSTCWLVYGLRIADVYVWAPNTIGLFMSALQFLCLCLFPRSRPTNAYAPVPVVSSYSMSDSV